MRAFLCLAVLFGCGCAVQARDDGQWGDVSPEIRKWFSSLTQPGHPDWSCCADADAYFADEYSVDSRTETVLAAITDNRGHSIPVGTRIAIPFSKINREKNLAGHALLFLGGMAAKPAVFCFLPNDSV